MKKILALIMTALLLLSMGTVAFAVEGEGNYTDHLTATFKKVYEATNTGTTSPAETFAFTIVSSSVTDAADGITAANMPLPTVGSVVYGAGEAGSVTKVKDVTINLPEYNSVGIYTYTINETAGTTAGVTYHSTPITLVVTVIEQNGKLRIAGVHTESPINPDSKQDTITNTYSAGTLNISKTVTGNLGDKTKYFEFTVTLTGEAGKTYEASYAVTGGSYETNPTSIVIGTPTIFYLKDGETLSIANLPYGVTYTVVEADYTTEANGGYDTPIYNFGDEAKKIDTAADTVNITNNKGGTPDTGIFLDSLPYMVILAVVALAGILFFVKRRKVEE